MKKYTSFELSKKLSENGCELYSKKVYVEHLRIKNDWFLTNRAEELAGDTYSAYDILWDISVEHQKEFFGDNHLKLAFQLFKIVANPCSQITIENYIWNNCLFNPDNKRGK